MDDVRLAREMATLLDPLSKLQAILTTGKGGKARLDAIQTWAQGYGETQPIDRRSNENAWAKNRRVEFLILKRNNDSGN